MPENLWERARIRDRVALMRQENARDSEGPDTQADRRDERQMLLNFAAWDILQGIETIVKTDDGRIWTVFDAGLLLAGDSFRDLGFNVKKTNDNPAQRQGNRIYIDAGVLLARCQRQGINCTALASELSVQMPDERAESSRGIA